MIIVTLMQLARVMLCTKLYFAMSQIKDTQWDVQECIIR